MSKLLFIFLDGVGLAAKAQTNPFYLARTGFLEKLLKGKLLSTSKAISQKDLVFKKLDANLGVKGLPQSATGQTAILTGKNAAKTIGNHYGPQPGPSLKKIIDEGNIFLKLTRHGKTVRLLNAYPPAYFRQKRLRESAIVYAYKSIGQELSKLESYKNGESISVDLSGEYFATISPDIEIISAYNMGKRAANIAQNYDFSFFDFWPTDHAGHRADIADAVSLIEKLDLFLAGINAEQKDLSLLISSDHGNLEDKTTKSHSRNKVPLIAVGKEAYKFKNVNSIIDLSRAIEAVVMNNAC